MNDDSSAISQPTKSAESAAGVIEEGGACPESCGGHLILPPVENCSCHISAPCDRCLSNALTCDSCGWECPPPVYTKANAAFYSDWIARHAEYRARGHTFPHGGRIFNMDMDSRSGSTMAYTGQYEGPVTPEDIYQHLGDGTFGHRGPTMSNGRFWYTKVTD